LTAATTRRRFTIAYVGNLYDRSIGESLRQAFDAWRARHPGDFDRVAIEYAAPSSRVLDKGGFRPPYLTDQGYVSHRTAIEIRARSDLQVFAHPTHFKAHVASCKIYEMIRVGVPHPRHRESRRGGCQPDRARRCGRGGGLEGSRASGSRTEGSLPAVAAARAEGRTPARGRQITVPGAPGAPPGEVLEDVANGR
jgi:hypothetical protein